MSDAVAEKVAVETAFEWQARTTIGAAKNLAHWVKTTQGDKLTWQPSTGAESQTRSILEQMVECVRVNRRFAKWLVEDSSDLPEGPVLTDAQQVETELLASAEELAAVIRGLDPGTPEKQFQTAWGPMTGREMMVIPMANMYYHGGTVNFIQTLYGDTEMHFPE